MPSFPDTRLNLDPFARSFRGESSAKGTFAKVFIRDSDGPRLPAPGWGSAYRSVTVLGHIEACWLKSILDLSPNNILVGVDAVTVSKVEQAEIDSPSPRKILADRTIHLSYAMPTTYEPPVITDFGAARLGDPGQKHSGDVMPGVFRAPEIIAGMEWDSKIDIWSIGVMVCTNALKSFPCVTFNIYL